MTTEMIVRKDNTSYLTDPAKFEHLWRVAKCFAISTLTPETLRGKPEDCFILCQLAMRLDVDPFMLMQNTYVVHGRPGMEAKLQIGLLNASGLVKGGVKYEFDGDGDEYGCTAVVVDAKSGETIRGPKITWRMAKAEKWDQDKKSQRTGYVQVSKWKTMPELMFRYRAASVLIRTQYPEVTLGLMTPEELEEQVIDVEAAMARPATLPGQSKSEALAAAITGQDEPTPQDVAEADAGSKPQKRRGRPPKAAAVEPEPEPEQPQEATQDATTPPEEPAGTMDLAAWYQASMSVLEGCESMLDLVPLCRDIRNHEYMQGLDEVQQQALAEAMTAAQARLR